jgi:hypothetical protein
MKKSLRSIILFIVFVILSGSISAQQSKNVSDKIIEIRSEKTEILNTTQRTETILDSVIYYKFTSETDSVRIRKRTYEVSEDGKFEILLEYSWRNNQWVDSAKTEFTYNDSDMITLYEQFHWDIEQSIWVNYRIIDITYDENGYEDIFTYTKWNIELDRWDNYYKEDSDYNEYGDLISIVDWLGNENNEWEFYYKEVNTYNADEHLIESYIAFWNVDFDEWDNYQKEVFSYNVSGLVDNRLYYLWMLDDWSLNLKTDYFYTGSDEFDSLVTYQWNVDEWLLFAQLKYGYDENDNLSLRLELSWENEVWVNKFKTEIEYDDNNNPILTVLSTWSVNADAWIYEIKYENLFDEMNNNIMTSYYYWQVELGYWVGTDKIESVYNDEGKRLLTTEYKWDDLLADWVVDEKAFYYRSVITQLPEMNSDDFVIFPNPVINTLFVKNQNSKNLNCSIVSISGQQLMQFHIDGYEASISMKDLPKGIYFLQINNSAETVIKKIIKK